MNKINECDKCVYMKNTENGYVILCLYVDDMLIVGSNARMVKSTKDILNSRFDMKDMGEAGHILGMRIERNRSKQLIWLSQTEYIDKVLQRFNMDKGKALSCPLPSYVKLSKHDCPMCDEDKAEMNKLPYASAVGSLMYAMIATHLDITFVVEVVSNYMSNPSKKH